MYKFLIAGLVIAAVAAIPAPDAGVVQGAQNLDCLQQDEDLLSCLAIKAANSLSRAARSNNIQIFDGITFVKEADVPVERSGKSLKSETELLNELPRDASDRTLKLASMLFESAMSFFKTHSLKFSLPEGSVSRALEEGRGKIKKMILPLVAAAGVKIFALVPILLGGLSLLVFKALVVGKIALLLAGILAFQKLFGGNGVSASSFFSKNAQPTGWIDAQPNQGWSASSAQPQGYYRRSFEPNTNADAHSMAYAAQAPVTNETD